jgi:hypothetical protein
LEKHDNNVNEFGDIDTEIYVQGISGLLGGECRYGSVVAFDTVNVIGK